MIHVVVSLIYRVEASIPVRLQDYKLRKSALLVLIACKPLVQFRLKPLVPLAVCMMHDMPPDLYIF